MNATSISNVISSTDLKIFTAIITITFKPHSRHSQLNIARRGEHYSFTLERICNFLENTATAPAHSKKSSCQALAPTERNRLSVIKMVCCSLLDIFINTEQVQVPKKRSASAEVWTDKQRVHGNAITRPDIRCSSGLKLLYCCVDWSIAAACPHNLHNLRQRTVAQCPRSNLTGLLQTLVKKPTYEVTIICRFCYIKPHILTKNTRKCW